jgi:hypothetical protein
MSKFSAFIRGVVSVFDFGSNFNLTGDCKPPICTPPIDRKRLMLKTNKRTKTDAEALAGDWQKIGQDFRSVMYTYDPIEQTGEKESNNDNE